MQAEETLEMPQDNFHFTRGGSKVNRKKGNDPRFHSSFPFLPEVPGQHQYQSSKDWGTKRVRSRTGRVVGRHGAVLANASH